MSRKLVLFGNGLGRAINNDFYRLDLAFKEIWAGDLLDSQEKELIRKLVPGYEDGTPPSDEAELMNAQLAIQSVQSLESILPAGIASQWLSDEARSVAKTIFKLNAHVARYFHSTSNSLPKRFSQDLVRFVNSRRPHIANLNYDPLLYDAFCRKIRVGNFPPVRICDDFDGALIDGFTRTGGFIRENFHLIYGEPKGYLLHLHGTPLYSDAEVEVAGKMVNRPTKLNREEMRSGKSSGRHIVLNHSEQKRSIIASSEILSLYWEAFREALAETKEVLLFGYSGFDDHVNHEIAKLARSSKKTIVEWNGISGSARDRQRFWGNRLGDQVDVIRLDNILDFSGWDSEAY